jgi:hypothetical protein
MFRRFRLGFNYHIPINNKNINDKINYFRQYETRDFNYKKRKRNFVNYHLTKEFRQYKPNLKV